MKTIDTSGNEHHMDLRPSSYPMKGEKACKSKIQFQCGQYLKKQLPHDVILEECRIPGENLSLDFFLPNYKTAIEVDGRQHDSYVEHFHGDAEGFKKSKERDSRKKRWCEINDITLIKVSSLEELKQWV